MYMFFSEKWAEGSNKDLLNTRIAWAADVPDMKSPRVVSIVAHAHPVEVNTYICGEHGNTDIFAQFHSTVPCCDEFRAGRCSIIFHGWRRNKRNNVFQFAFYKLKERVGVELFSKPGAGLGAAVKIIWPLHQCLINSFFS
jgi:hypothetical protein